MTLPLAYEFETGKFKASTKSRLAILDEDSGLLVPVVNIGGSAGPTTPAGEVFDGQTTWPIAPGTAVALNGTQALTTGVLVQAISTNTDSIFIGGASVATDSGVELTAGESVYISTDDLSNVYIMGIVDGEGVKWTGS